MRKVYRFEDNKLCRGRRWAESITGNMMPKFGYGPFDVKVGSEDWCRLWERVRATPLLQNRLTRWPETGEGTEKYPSDNDGGPEKARDTGEIPQHKESCQ